LPSHQNIVVPLPKFNLASPSKAKRGGGRGGGKGEKEGRIPGLGASLIVFPSLYRMSLIFSVNSKRREKEGKGRGGKRKVIDKPRVFSRRNPFRVLKKKKKKGGRKRKGGGYAPPRKNASIYSNLYISSCRKMMAKKGGRGGEREKKGKKEKKGKRKKEGSDNGSLIN